MRLGFFGLVLDFLAEREPVAGAHYLYGDGAKENASIVESEKKRPMALWSPNVLD